MWQRLTRRKILIVILIIAVYVAVLARNSTESTRRSLQLREETPAPDRLLVSVLVTGVNPVTQELSAQLGFRLVGKIARDEVTPAVDLRLLINNVSGQQEFDFPKGKRMNRIEAVFPLNGDLNKYPFDKYETTLWLLMTTPMRNDRSQAQKLPETPEEGSPDAEQWAVGAVTLQRNAPVPLSLSISAALPGIKFTGNVARKESSQVTGINLNLRRADNLIAVSLLVMAMMACLAASVLAMVLRVTTTGGKHDLVPLTSSISWIFGLPALRNVQPGVQPVGAFSD